jgi:transcription elongation factor GreA
VACVTLMAVRTPTRRLSSFPSETAKQPVYLTAEGKASLETELNDLLTVQRPAIAQAILSAREDGDLKENGAYHDAKDRQGLMEGRIRELKVKLERAQVIEHRIATEDVTLGSTVTVAGTDGAEFTYTIVGSMESSVAQGRISNESPIGRALLGLKPGDEAVVKTPGGETPYRVVAVS